MRVGERVIGEGPTYVIAEIGSNHNGSLDLARRLIRTAKQSGADCAKFQFFRPDKLYPGTVTAGATPEEWLPELQHACFVEGIDFLCSVFDLDTLRVYLALKPAAVKIASPEATNEELLYYASGVPVFVSLGALDWDGCDRVNDVLAASHAEYALLQCVSTYPTYPNELNLRVIPEMRRRYKVPVGLSDHSPASLDAPQMAVALGACVVEKHLTADRSLPGADHSFAIEPDEFREMVDQIRLVEDMLGDGNKRVMGREDASDRRGVSV